MPSATYCKRTRWRARYVDDDGREHTKAFAGKTDLQQWLDNEVTAKFATGTYVAPAAGGVTVDDVYASWSSARAHISPKTAASCRSAWGNRVEPQWADIAVIDVRTAAVRAWVAGIVADGVDVPTIENTFGLLRQVLGAAVEDNRIPATRAMACGYRNESTPIADT